VAEICAVLRFYAAYNGSLLPTFRDNLVVPSLGVQCSKKKTVAVCSEIRTKHLCALSGQKVESLDVKPGET
jgi:hypothetical protein